MTFHRVVQIREQVMNQLNLITPDLPIDERYGKLLLLTTLRLDQNKTLKMKYTNIVQSVRNIVQSVRKHCPVFETSTVNFNRVNRVIAP